MRKLNEKQSAFVHHYCTTLGAIGNATQSARLAGYSDNGHLSEIGYGLLQKRHIRHALRESLSAKISGPLACLAVKTLEGILRDPKVSPKTRLDASKTLLDRAGIIGKATAEDLLEKPINEMTPAELYALATSGNGGDEGDYDPDEDEEKAEPLALRATG